MEPIDPKQFDALKDRTSKCGVAYRDSAGDLRLRKFDGVACGLTAGHEASWHEGFLATTDERVAWPNGKQVSSPLHTTKTFREVMRQHETDAFEYLLPNEYAEAPQWPERTERLESDDEEPDNDARLTHAAAFASGLIAGMLLMFLLFALTVGAS